jgi:hypothetical protein
MQVNVRDLYDLGQIKKVADMYDDIAVSENEEDDAVDNAGYTGNFRRIQSKNLESITEK